MLVSDCFYQRPLSVVSVEWYWSDAFDPQYLVSHRAQTFKYWPHIGERDARQIEKILF